MKRTVNGEAIVLILAVLGFVGVCFLLGFGLSKIPTKNPDYWGGNIWLNAINAFALLFAVALVIFIIIMASIGIKKFFNWVFPKNSSPDKPNRDGE